MRPVKKYQWALCCAANRHLAEEFIASLRQKHAPSTVEVYSGELKQWFWWLKQFGGNRRHVQCRPYLYRRYESWLYLCGEKDYSVKNKIRAINALNKYIKDTRAEDFPRFAKRIKPYRPQGRDPIKKGGGGSGNKTNEATTETEAET